MNVTQVINFDLPPTVDQYIHQIGRFLELYLEFTKKGRAGRVQRKGYAISFINNENKKMFADYYRLWKNAKVSMPAKFLNSEGMRQAAQRYATENKKQKT